MTKLVECPECEGTGVIRQPDSKAPSKGGSSRIEGNIAEFIGRAGVSTEQKPNQEFTTCPKCKGFGYVRG